MPYYPIYCTSKLKANKILVLAKTQTPRISGEGRLKSILVEQWDMVSTKLLFYFLCTSLSVFISPLSKLVMLIVRFNLSGEKSHRPSKKHKSSAKVWIRMIFQLLLQFVWYSFYNIKHLMQESIPVEDYEAYVGGEEIDDDVRGDGIRLSVLSMVFWNLGFESMWLNCEWLIDWLLKVKWRRGISPN